MKTLEIGKILEKRWIFKKIVEILYKVLKLFEILTKKLNFGINLRKFEKYPL